VVASPTVRARRLMGGYLGVMAACVAVVAAVGVFARGDLTTRAVVSPRGEPYEMVTTGVYAWNPERLVAEGIGWDVFTLFVAVPALLVAIRGVVRGSLRWRLVATGLLAYVAYQYLMYAMAWAIGPLFLPFVALFAASAAGIAWFVSSVPVGELPRHLTGSFPRRSMMVLCALMALLLLQMWLPLVAAVQRGQLEGNLHGQMTLVVQALDLGIVVPVAVTTLVLLWRRSPAGVLLAAALVVKGLAMAVAICAMLVAAWVVEGAPDVGGFAIFVTVALACLGLIVALYRSIRETPLRETPLRDTPLRETPVRGAPLEQAPPSNRDALATRQPGGDALDVSRPDAVGRPGS
jgi:hypothetical protein